MQPVFSKYESYLQDESRLRGSGESIAFPESTAELAGLMAAAHKGGLRITLQGARTGLCGGAIPQGGQIINTTRMAAIFGLQDGLMHVQAGAPLQDIEAAAAKHSLHFPPNPTEATATIGGVFATGAAGPSSLLHGASSRHVEWLRWVTPTGHIWEITRGEYLFDASGCRLPNGAQLPAVDWPPTPIQALMPRPGMDLIDFLTGSEGRLGAAAEFKLRLQPLPKALWGVVYFLDKASLLGFADMLRGWHSGEMAGSMLCCEYYDTAALRLLDSSRHNAAMKNLPGLPPAEAAIYVELQGDDEDALEEALMMQLEGFVECGGLEENTWAENSSPGVAKLRGMRHALPELVGEHVITDTGGNPLPRLETDFTGPEHALADYLSMYTGGLQQAGLDAVIYGHLLQNRMHVAFLPKQGEQQLCQQTMEAWAKRVAEDGGLLASENGMGRLKAGLVEEYLTDAHKSYYLELDRVLRL